MKSLQVEAIPANDSQWSLHLPGSKSLSNRILILAAMSRSEIEVKNILYADDTNALLDILITLGYKVTKRVDSVFISPPNQFLEKYPILNCRNAGTVLRFLPALLLNFSFIHDLDFFCEFQINAWEQLKNRPHAKLFTALKDLGVSTLSDKMPVVLNSQDVFGKTEISCEMSSQYLSGLLLLASSCRNSLQIERVGDAFVQPGYVEMTLDCIQEFGGEISYDASLRMFKSHGKKLKKLPSIFVEPDVSTLCYFVLFSVVHQWNVHFSEIGTTTRQPDLQFIKWLKGLGVSIDLKEKEINVSNGSLRTPVSYQVCDLNDCSDQLYTYAATALIFNFDIEITGVHHTQFHETQRVDKLIENIHSIGGKAEKTEQGLKIYSTSKEYSGNWNSFEDHRMAMAGFVLGSHFKSVTLTAPDCVSKTCPNFFDYFKSQGVKLLTHAE